MNFITRVKLVVWSDQPMHQQPMQYHVGNQPLTLPGYQAPGPTPQIAPPASVAPARQRLDKALAFIVVHCFLFFNALRPLILETACKKNNFLFFNALRLLDLETACEKTIFYF